MKIMSYLSVHNEVPITDTLSIDFLFAKNSSVRKFVKRRDKKIYLWYNTKYGEIGVLSHVYYLSAFCAKG